MLAAVHQCQLQGLTNGGQQDEANAVCYHRFSRADLCRVKEEEWPDVGGGVTNERPADVEGSKYQEGEEIAADALRPRQYWLQSLAISSTHIGAPDAVEEEYLNHHDAWRDRVQVDEGKGPEPPLAKDVADYNFVSVDSLSLLLS